MTSGRVRSAVTMVLLAAFALSLVGCGSSPGLRMVGAPGTAAAAGVADVPLDAPISFGSVVLCISASGTATVRSVAVHQPTGDLEVQAFAARLNPFTRSLDGLGIARSTIADLHLDFDPAEPALVSGVCTDDVETAPSSVAAQMVELAVQVARRSGDAAGGSALDVTYAIASETRMAVIPFGIWLCAATCPPAAGDLYRP